MGLREEISEWDGKSTKTVEDAYARYSADQGFLDLITSLLPIKEFETGASWLLKKHLETGVDLTELEASGICDSLQYIRDDWARLHMLQIIGQFEIGYSQKDLVEEFIRDSVGHRQKFVSAWALNAFAELARQFPEYRAEVETLLDSQYEYGSPAVKARIRNIRKAGF